MAYQSFEDLEVWKAACRLAVSIHEMFRHSKDFVMHDQIHRSSVSIASNIAEGMERGGVKDTIRFLHYAKGSCAEARTQLYLSQRMEIISDVAETITEARKISGQLQNLIKSLEDRNQGA